MINTMALVVVVAVVDWWLMAHSFQFEFQLPASQSSAKLRWINQCLLLLLLLMLLLLLLLLWSTKFIYLLLSCKFIVCFRFRKIRRRNHRNTEFKFIVIKFVILSNRKNLVFGIHVYVWWIWNHWYELLL